MASTLLSVLDSGESDLQKAQKRDSELSVVLARLENAERALEEERRLLELFLEHNPIYVFFKDEQARAIRLSRNYEKMLGRPLEELLGKDMREIFPLSLAESMIADDLRILSEGKPVEIIEELGGRIFSTIKFPIHEGSRPSLLAGYTIDITERVLAERKLATALREKEGLLLELQHRVKNSFATISGIVGLEQGRAQNEKLASTLEEIKSRIDSLGLLYDLLFASGKTQEVKLDDYLDDVASNLIDSYSPEQGRILLEKNLCSVTIDVKRAVPIGLMVNELVTNSLRHAFPHNSIGTIRILLFRERNSLILRIEDDGIGLPPQYSGNDFANESEGLGLVLVNMLSAQLGARLDHSGSPEKGTTFELHVPLDSQT